MLEAIARPELARERHQAALQLGAAADRQRQARILDAFDAQLHDRSKAGSDTVAALVHIAVALRRVGLETPLETAAFRHLGELVAEEDAESEAEPFVNEGPIAREAGHRQQAGSCCRQGNSARPS